MIEANRRVCKKYAHSARKPKDTQIKDPEEVAREKKVALLKANKQYRLMKAFTLPYDKYYKAQMGKESSIYNFKTTDAFDLCIKSKIINSDTNQKHDKKKKAEFLSSFEEYMNQKIAIAKRRKELEERKSQAIHAHAYLEDKRRQMKHSMRLNGRFTSVQNLLDWIPRFSDQLHAAMNNKNRILSRVCLQRREVASILQQRYILREQIEKALDHLAEGKYYLNDIFSQAMQSFKDREESLYNSFRAKQIREGIIERGKKSVQLLNIQYGRAVFLVQFYTIKNQTRIQVQNDDEVTVMGQIMEKEVALKKYMSDTLPFIGQVFTFFRSNDINYITKNLRITWDEIFHIQSLRFIDGSEAANNSFQTMMLFEKVQRLSKHSQKITLEREHELMTLQSEADYMLAKKNLQKERLEKLEERKKCYIELIDQMLKQLPIKYVLRKQKKWDTLETMEIVLRKLEKIAVIALEIYKRTHPELYWHPYANSRKTKLPNDPKLKARACTILLEKKQVKEVFKMPVAPCFYCIQEQRSLAHWHSEDVLRSHEYYEGKVRMYLNTEDLACLHKPDCCPATKVPLKLPYQDQNME